MTTVRRLNGWNDARLCRLNRPLRWSEKVGNKTVRRQTSFVIESKCMGTLYYVANQHAQVVGPTMESLPAAA